MPSASFPSRLLHLSQLLMNKDLKTSEAALPTKDAIAFFSLGRVLQHPWKGLSMLSAFIGRVFITEKQLTMPG